MRNIARIVLPALLLLASACAAQEAPPLDPNLTPEQAAAAQHFLGAEFGKMTPVAGFKERYNWRNPSFNPKNYSAVIIDPSVVWNAQAMAKSAGVSTEELDAVARHLDLVLMKTMQGIDFPVKSAAAPRTLRISAAITQVKASNPTRNTISSVLPVGILISLGRKAVGSADPNVGSCSIEVRFSDAMSGETMGLFADHKDGDKYDSANFHQLGQAQEAVDKWSEDLRAGVLRVWGVRPQ